MGRLYNAVCGWLEAHAASMSGERVVNEPHPEGNNFSQSEYAHSFSGPPELHVSSDRQALDDEGVYQVRPLGFRRNGSC